MTDAIDPKQNRREWFRATARGVAVAGVSCLSALIVWRASRADGHCGRPVRCVRCASLTGCGLPLAVSTKSSMKGDS